MGITLKQIADLAGVHKSTVDKVIHNRPGVSDAKREQIRALLQEYGYESNPLAKALNYQKKKMTIGVLSSWNQLRSVEQRERAFFTYLTQKYPDIQIVMTVDTQESPQIAYDRTRALLQEHEDLQALFITCGCVLDICRAVRDAGRAGSLTVICYERYPEIVELVRRGEIACTISGDLHEQGRLAMRLLFEYVIYDRMPKTHEIYTKNEILIEENI